MQTRRNFLGSVGAAASLGVVGPRVFANEAVAATAETLRVRNCVHSQLFGNC